MAVLVVGVLCAEADAPFVFTQTAGLVSTTNATLNGMVAPNGLPTTAWFEWGTNGTWPHRTEPADVGDGSTVIRLSVLVSGLEEEILYSCRLVASNSAGLVEGSPLFFGIGRGFVAWGDNSAGQLNLPASISNVVAVAAGNAHAVALRTDGRAIAWGANGSGQTNVPPSANGLIAIAAGAFHNLGLRTNGMVRVWGADNYGQVAGSIGLTNIIALAAGQDHSLVLKRDGTVKAWGDNGYGQTNVPANLAEVVAIGAGQHHCLAVRSDGSVVSWGWGKYGQTNVPPDVTNAVAVAGGSGHSLALRRDGTVIAWGSNTYGQTNVPTGLNNVVAISAGAADSLALRTDGTVVMWGYNAYGQRNVPVSMKPALVASTGGNHTVALVVGPDLPFALIGSPKWISENQVSLRGWVIPNGAVSSAWFEWGTNSNFGSASSPTDVGNGTNAVPLTAEVTGLEKNRPHICRIVVSNRWGQLNGPWQLVSIGRKLSGWGAAAFPPTGLPRGLSNLVAIASGVSHGLALQANGVVVAWGDDTWGQTNVPEEMTNAVRLAAGDLHSLILGDDGNLVAFGHNNYGQATVPPELTNAVALSAGRYHNLAVRNDGTVVAWGQNNWGATSVPPGLTDATHVAAGWGQSLALRRDGRLAYWGYDDWGLAGIAGTLSNVVTIASGYSHCLALLGNGTVVAWGRNNQGQTSVPTGLSNVVAVAAGPYHSLALRSDGFIAAWGDNSSGQTNVPKHLTAAAADGGPGNALAIGGNVEPLVQSQTNQVPWNEDSIIQVTARDPNNDPCALRVSSLPVAGDLYQFSPEGRGATIASPDTLLTDSLGRVIFSPAYNGCGIPYATFEILASDGEEDSAPATVTVNVVPRPVVEVSGASATTQGELQLEFGGLTNAAYSIWASADLINWSLVGAPSQPKPGVFLFTDANTNSPQRFYRICSP